MSLNSQLCECTCSYVQVILKARDVMWYVTLYVTVNSKPEWSQLQLDLFLIFIWTYSCHLHCLLCVCIMYESVIQLGSSHVMISMCSIYGIHTIVTMVCYGMYLSLNLSP